MGMQMNESWKDYVIYFIVFPFVLWLIFLLRHFLFGQYQ